ncbi:MAG: cytochrome c biogenesis protein CcdA [Candidatus Bathyarchaeia archaeon]
MVGLMSLNKFYIIILLSIIAALLSQIILVNAKANIEVFIYDFPEFESSKYMNNYLSKYSELKPTFYYLNDSSNLKDFLNIANLLVTHGVSVLPPNFCTPCEMARGLNWQEIYIQYLTPLTLIFRDGRLMAMVISRYDENTLEQALTHSSSGNKTKVFLSGGSTELLKDEARTKLEELFKNKIRYQVNFFHILPIIVIAASLDAINPCEFFILIVFLSLVAIRFGREALLKFGLAFSVAIFAAYFMMGLGIWRLIGYLHEARIVVIILGLSLGLRSMLNFIFGLFGLSIGFRETIGSLLNKRFKRIPKLISEKVATQLRRFSNNPVSAFLTGIVTSIFLLPCTSGPYLIALSLIANLETQMQGLLLLILYNGIIMAPFLVITFGIYLLKIKSSRLKRWFSTKQRWLNLISGLLMLTLSIYLIFYAL